MKDAAGGGVAEGRKGKGQGKKRKCQVELDGIIPYRVDGTVLSRTQFTDLRSFHYRPSVLNCTEHG